MSTKTSIKRIALVAVSALGFGMFTSVVPAFAEAEATTELTNVAIASPGTGRVGSAFVSNVAFDFTAAVEADEVVTLRARFDSKPATSTAAVGFNGANLNAGDLAVTDTATVSAAGAAGNELLPAKTVVQADNTAATAGAGYIAGQVGFIPDVIGTYTVTVWHDANGNGLIDATESYSTKDFVVGNAPASVKVTSISGTGIVSSDALVKLQLLDSAGASAGLAANESITLTSGSADTDFTFVNGVAASGTNTETLTAASFVKGYAYIGFNDDLAAGQTITVTIAGVGGSVTSISGTFTQKFVPSAAPTDGATVMVKSDGVTAATYGVASNVYVAGTLAATTAPIASKTLYYLTTITAGIAAAATDQYVGATVTDNGGYVTGAIAQGITTNLVYTKAIALSAASATATTYTGTFSITYTNPTIAETQFGVTVNDDSSAVGDGADDTAIGVSTALVNINTLASAVAVSPSAALSLKTGSSITYVATVVDQFGRALPNASVAVSGGTRNLIVIQPTAFTDANGKASFTIADAPAAGVTSLTDTFTFAASYNGGTSAGTAAGAITWSATGPVVGTVKITGGNNTTAGVAATSNQWKDINAGDGAQSTTAPITATVKDASGNLLAGVPVTFTVAGSGVAVPSNKVTVYTGADGTAASTVYAWLTGSYTVTATAGGVSGTSVYAFRQSAAGEERSISASVSGNLVTAKVVDRFGNPVPGVTVYATKSGEGYFGTGTIKTNTTTDNDGLAQFLVSGSATVTVATYDVATAVAPLGSGQTCARAGALDCNVDAADDTAFTAYVAGTSTVAEKGVGSTFSAAGVALATVDVTGTSSTDAVDAANEATDAANAATDAANAAAEAADAATAAAQDAQAAVAALATQVASLIAGIKAQITTLTNLVIKIQKKVKA